LRNFDLHLKMDKINLNMYVQNSGLLLKWNPQSVEIGLLSAPHPTMSKVDPPDQGVFLFERFAEFFSSEVKIFFLLWVREHFEC
jgi:hypothetical protein